MSGFIETTTKNFSPKSYILIGTYIGTSVLAWIIASPAPLFSFLFIAIGGGIIILLKNKKFYYIGFSNFGIGLFLLGITVLKNGLAQFKVFSALFSEYGIISTNFYIELFILILVGIILAYVFKSRAALLAITFAIACEGILDLDGCAALVLGEYAGITLLTYTTHSISHIHTRRITLNFSLVNTATIILLLLLLTPFVHLVEILIPGSSNYTIHTLSLNVQYPGTIDIKPLMGYHVAALFTLICLIPALGLLLFSPLINIISKKWAKHSKTIKTEDFEFSNVEPFVERIPALGLAEAKKKLVAMAEKVVSSALVVQDIVGSEYRQKKLCDEVLENEKTIDRYNKTIRRFLTHISSFVLTRYEGIKVSEFIALAHYLEKYSDYLEHIVRVYREIEQDQIEFTEAGRQTVVEIFREASNFFNISFGAFEENVEPGSLMEESRGVNNKIKGLIRQAKRDHFSRIREKICTSEEAILLIDILNDLDGMRAKSFNIAGINTGTQFK